MKFWWLLRRFCHSPMYTSTIPEPTVGNPLRHPYHQPLRHPCQVYQLPFGVKKEQLSIPKRNQLRLLSRHSYTHFCHLYGNRMSKRVVYPQKNDRFYFDRNPFFELFRRRSLRTRANFARNSKPLVGWKGTDFVFL